MRRIGGCRALVICTPRGRSRSEEMLKSAHGLLAGFFDQVKMHVPRSTVNRARETAEILHADLLVAIGGGSAVGLAKAVALETGMPIAVVATTYAGSEVTSIFGVTVGSIKHTGRDERALPQTVIYDPKLTLDLPVGITVSSAINAIAHAAEGLYAADANPITDLIAQEGIRSIYQALPAVVDRPKDASGRSLLLYGSWLCGHVLNNASMGLHHKLCHTLGGSYSLPHAQTHAVILPHSIAYNAAYAPNAMRKLSTALDTAEPAMALFELAHRYGAPTSLSALGMPADGIEHVCRLALANRYPNPAPLDIDRLRALMERAFAGSPPLD